MTDVPFDKAFTTLTGNEPFPWQRALYERFVRGDFPSSCNLPTGLGKTSVVAVWLIALTNRPALVPRRLVYVVNRRTVVDQTTTEAETYRRKAEEAGICKPAISTLRGQFADNRQWSADPSRPAIIVGTVDMLGSRLLFSGYGVGFKARPLHAGFLGQDVLLVHDEAHLEPAFQDLLVAIREEQQRCPWERNKFRVLELSATTRGEGETFGLTKEEKNPPTPIPEPTAPLHHVWRRQKAKKAVHLHENKDAKKLADEIVTLALAHKDKNRAVLVFIRKVEDVEKVVKKLPRGRVAQLTGTLRGKERDELIDTPIFRRFLRQREQGETVWLVCTSAGEVGVNLSADDLVCDLSTFDSMAQRFGRVNRFGDCQDTRIDVVHPTEFDEEDEQQRRLKKTRDLLRQLQGDGCPAALGQLDPHARLEAFAPPPTILQTSDVLFDAWALTTVRDRLPGRPPVEPYLHGVSGWQPPETHVAWRDEVGVVTGDLLRQHRPEDLLEVYPLKPHEVLRDRSDRVHDHLVALARRHPDAPVWLLDDDGEVVVFKKLRELANKESKERINFRTVILPPRVGGLTEGLLNGEETAVASDVADDWFVDEAGPRGRQRDWSHDPRPKPFKGLRLVAEIDTAPDVGEEEVGEAVTEDLSEDEQEAVRGRYWRWYVRGQSADDDGSKTSSKAVEWGVHVKDVKEGADRIVETLSLPNDLKRAVVLAAEWHDLGKLRVLFQGILGNTDPARPLAKSGGQTHEFTDYRHEFGSLLDVLNTEMNPLAQSAEQGVLRRMVLNKRNECLAQYEALSDDLKDVVLHLIAVHHGYGRPDFPADRAFDPEASRVVADKVAREVPRRFARLQRKYGRWGLAYLESLLRAADYAASANPSKFVEDEL